MRYHRRWVTSRFAGAPGVWHTPGRCGLRLSCRAHFLTLCISRLSQLLPGRQSFLHSKAVRIFTRGGAFHAFLQTSTSSGSRWCSSLFILSTSSWVACLVDLTFGGLPYGQVQDIEHGCVPRLSNELNIVIGVHHRGKTAEDAIAARHAMAAS